MTISNIIILIGVGALNYYTIHRYSRLLGSILMLILSISIIYFSPDAIYRYISLIILAIFLGATLRSI